MESGRESVEGSFESVESDAERIRERGDELEERAENLSEALAKLEADTAVTKSLEANERDLEAQREENEAERTDALASLDAIRAALEAVEETNDRSDAALDSLRELGEDVSEAESIIEDRRRWIEELNTRVEHLYELLGENYNQLGVFSPSGKKNLESFAEKDEEAEQQASDASDSWSRRDSPSESAQTSDPVAAYHNYMTSHGWKREDFPVYSKTLEWRRLVHAAYPNYRRPSLDQGTARKLLTEYMHSNNYGRADYPTYSKDPEWQYLTLTALPETMGIVQSWAKEVNPNYENMALPYEEREQYATNCGSCAFALEQHFNGVRPEQRATNVNIGTDEGMERATGLTCKYMSPDSIRNLLVSRGPGSHLIVGVNREPVRVIRDNEVEYVGRPGHWFNAYYDGRQVYTIDGQTGQIFGWPHDYGYVSEWCAMV